MKQTMFLCHPCRETLNGIYCKELPRPAEKRECTMCGRTHYGQWYIVSDKEVEADDQTH